MVDRYLNSLLGENESMLFITRQHWLVLLREIVLEILSTLAIAILITVILVIWQPVPIFGLAYLVLMIPLLSLLRDTLVWSNHKFIVTNRRVIQIFGVFNKNVTDSSLEKVNDVKMEQSLLGRTFGYGDIQILTAAELGVNRFSMIGNPIHFKTAMLNAKQKLEHGEDLPHTVPSINAREDVPALITRLDVLRKQGVLNEEEFAKKKAELLSRL
jgi:uncharacterized membrane protein YdbT with pleckstrin-like domain